MSNSKSPLRYPGGKSRASKKIAQFFPNDLTKIVSPFFGGGSVEIELMKKGIFVEGYDLFNPLVVFWQQLKDNKQELLNTIEFFHNSMNKSHFVDMQDWIKDKDSELTPAMLGGIYFCLNRSSFSGTVNSGGYSPSHPRFNVNSIDRVRNFSLTNFSVDCLPFQESISKTNEFLYCDPPYLIKSNLYGHGGDLHKEFNHSELNSLLKTRQRWILSYNDCEEIREMYKDFEIVPLEWKYGMSKNKDSKEILILNTGIQK